MKTNEEKLAIYKAYLEGKEIEVKYLGEGEAWTKPAYMPSFNYSQYDYRIKAEPVKPAVAKAYRHKDGGLTWTLDDHFHTISPYFTRAPEFDIIAKEVK